MLMGIQIIIFHPTTKEKLEFEDYPEEIGSWKILSE